MTAPRPSTYPTPFDELVARGHGLADRLGRTPSGRELRKHLRIGHPRARQVLDAITADRWPYQATEPVTADPADPVDQADAVASVEVTPEVEPAATSAPAPAVRPSTRLLVWAALLAGIAASLAANVMHAQPGTGPRLASAWAPVALLLCVSVLERAPRHQNRAVAALSVAGMVVVAAVAAVVSYQHQYSLLVRFGETPLAATLLPVSVDGLLTVASLALLAMRGGRR